MASSIPERPFRFNLMTFNVWGKFNWPHREKPLESFFSRHKPDVLLLQEVSPDILSLIDKSLTSHSRVKDEKLEGEFTVMVIPQNVEFAFVSLF